MASLTLEKVSKIYPQKGTAGTRAVKSVDMKVKDGEIISLLGSSGCGKTSTLRMVAGFETVSEGDIRIGDVRINDLKPAQRNVAMAFEGYALYPPLNVLDNIGFSLLRNKVPRHEVKKRVAHVAQLLEITDILEAFPPTLSGGQQQRVSLARALVRDADLYLLDEPMSQLEPQLRAILRGRIKEHLIERKMTSVFVTHDQTEAVALSDRIAVMSNGVLQQFASPEDLKERPANLFVAGFIGEPAMNLVPAVIALQDGQLKVQIQDMKGTAVALEVSFGDVATIADAHHVKHGQKVYLGVRPHKVHLSALSLGQRFNQVDGVLAFNQWQGDQSHVGVEFGGHTLLVVTDGAVDFVTGNKLALHFPVNAMHLFDRETELALVHGTDVELARSRPAR